MAEVQGHLTLIGSNFDIQYVTQLLQHAPTWEKKVDDVLGNGKLFGHCEWGVTTEVLITNDFTEVTDRLMNILPCTTHEISQVARSLNCEWNILFSINITDEFPVITLSPTFCKFASDIDAIIGFDVT